MATYLPVNLAKLHYLTPISAICSRDPLTAECPHCAWGISYVAGFALLHVLVLIFLTRFSWKEIARRSLFIDDSNHPCTEDTLVQKVHVVRRPDGTRQPTEWKSAPLILQLATRLLILRRFKNYILCILKS